MSFKLYLCIHDTQTDVVSEFQLKTDDINLVIVDVRVQVLGASVIEILALVIGRSGLSCHSSLTSH